MHPPPGDPHDAHEPHGPRDPHDAHEPHGPRDPHDAHDAHEPPGPRDAHEPHGPRDPLGARELHDIADRADCERLVRAFYGRALTDPIIGWIFTDVARLDLEAHIPAIASFWETVLLGARSYGGGAFAPHVALHQQVTLRPGHFQRWLALWRTTVDELFAGEHAELAKAHAERVAQAFQRRLQAIPSQQQPGGLTITQHGG